MAEEQKQDSSELTQEDSNATADEEIRVLEAAAKRAREVAENLEASLDRIRAAKRQRLETSGAGQDGPDVLPPLPAADSGKAPTGPQHCPVSPTVAQLDVDNRKPSPIPLAASKEEEPRYVLSQVEAQSRAPNTKECVSWQAILEGSTFITMHDIGVAPDAVVVSMAQFQKCRLEKEDRIGRYKHQNLGFVGLCCKYCFGQPGYGRYFPSTSASFVSSFPQTVVKHIAEDCLGSPTWIKELVSFTHKSGQKSEPLHASHFGSKGLMERIWKVIRGPRIDDFPEEDNTKESRVLAIPVNRDDDLSMTWGDILGDGSGQLVTIADQYLVPASLFAAVAQFEPCKANEFDCKSIGRNRPGIDPGYPGICCKFCKGETPPVLPGARIFPAQPGSLAQIDTCGKLQAHIENDRCGKVPDGILRAIKALREREGNETRRYGSRKFFFHKVWARLHGHEIGESTPDAAATDTDQSDRPLAAELSELVKDSELVIFDSDRGMVSDAHLVAFAQLKPCTLTEQDQCGWYKSREIGFPGVCCRHCEGRPSSGRYFPKHGDFFLRSSKQSIIKHIIDNCPRCKPEVRDSLRELQRRDERRKGWKITNQSVLGQGKLFHERVWARLYIKLGVDKIYEMPPPEEPPNEHPNDSPAGTTVVVVENNFPAQTAAEEKSSSLIVVADHRSYPQSVDRDWITWHCLYSCLCIEDFQKIKESAQLDRAIRRLDDYHEKFQSTLRSIHPGGELGGELEFQAQHNWFAEWARKVRSGAHWAFKLTLDRRAVRTVLFCLYDMWQEGTLTQDITKDKELVRWVNRVFLLVVPFERAECLFAMRSSNNPEFFGMHWVSKLEEDNHPLLLEVAKLGDKPAMNRKFILIFRQVIEASNTEVEASNIKLGEQLISPSPCPKEPIDANPSPQPSLLDLPNDVFVDHSWVIQPRLDVADYIEQASKVEHFCFIYKSESWSNMLRVLRSEPQKLEIEDIEVFLELYHKLYLCVEDGNNTSVTSQAVLEKFPVQSFTNVLDTVLPIASYRLPQKGVSWPPEWLSKLCDTFGLDSLRRFVDPLMVVTV